MFPTFPLRYAPTCRECPLACTHNITQSNTNGNQGRPYYRCSANHPRTFSCFDDDIGISPSNHLCRCRYYGRKTRNGRGQYFYSCPVGACRWTQDADDDSAYGSSPSGSAAYAGSPAPQYGGSTYSPSPPSRYGTTTYSPSPTLQFGSASSQHTSAPYVFEAGGTPSPPYQGAMAVIPSSPKQVYSQTQNAATSTDLEMDTHRYGSGTYGSGASNGYGGSTLPSYTPYTTGALYGSNYSHRRRGCCGCSIM